LTDWVRKADELADTEGADPAEITAIVMENTANYEDPAQQCTSGVVSKLVEVAEKLLDRMLDNESDEYVNLVNVTLGIVDDWLSVTGDIFNHDVAWMEADHERMVGEATKVIAVAEKLAYFALKVSTSTELTNQYVVLRQGSQEDRGEHQPHVERRPASRGGDVPVRHGGRRKLHAPL